MVKAAGNKSHPAVLFFRTFFAQGGTKRTPPSKVAIYKAFRRLEPSKIGSKPQKRAKMGYDSYLPKRPVCRYHNIREVATHELRNTVTQRKGIDRPERRTRGKLPVSVMPGVCPPMTAPGLRRSLPFRDGEGDHLYV